MNDKALRQAIAKALMAEDENNPSWSFADLARAAVAAGLPIHADELQRGLATLPQGMFAGANRYDTDDECVLHLWTDDGRSFDVRWPREVVSA
ncbi:MAG TPA: hypothetical protein VFH56_12360 [Acidimicrobiales bacterium]|nr:hypothetical protein [Acidimicrobiales bacterium]